MSLLGKILRSSTAHNTNSESSKNTKDALKEFRPASVGVIPAESADFVSLEGQAYDGDLFHNEGMIQGGSDPNLLIKKDKNHPSSPQQQQQQEKVESNSDDASKSEGIKGGSKSQFSWQDFTTPAIMNKNEKERPTSRKLYLGSAGTTGTKSESPHGASTEAEAHSDVRITYIGGTDRPGTSADQDIIMKKKSIINRPTRSAGARPSPIRTSKFDHDGIRPPLLQRMSSFGGFEGLPEYLTEHYPTYGDDNLQRPPSRQGTAFPMNMDSEDSPVKPVNLADLDSDDDILKIERSPVRTAAKGIRSAPGKNSHGHTLHHEVANSVVNGKTYNAADEKMRVNLTAARHHGKKPPGTGAKIPKDDGTTSVRAWSASRNGTRVANNPITDGFTELGDASMLGEMPFKIHVNTGTSGKNKGKGKTKGKKKSLRRQQDTSTSPFTGSGDDDGKLQSEGMKHFIKGQVSSNSKIDGNSNDVGPIKQRPTLEIMGAGGSLLHEKLLRSKPVANCQRLHDLDDDFIVIDDEDDDDDNDDNDDVDDDADNEGDEDNDIDGDRDNSQNGQANDEGDDSGEYSYKNEGNLAITELETNLDMDFLKLFASN